MTNKQRTNQTPKQSGRLFDISRQSEQDRDKLSESYDDADELEISGISLPETEEDLRHESRLWKVKSNATWKRNRRA